MLLSLVFGFAICLLVLSVVFSTSESSIPFFKKLYKLFPPLLWCYVLPALLVALWGKIPAQNNPFTIPTEQLQTIASKVFLPFALFFFCLSLNPRNLKQLGTKALIAFFAGTLGIMLGGPVALLLVSQITELPDGLWRGLSTLAGSWIGGGANQLAMKTLFEPSQDLFSICLAVDILLANAWLAVLFFLKTKETAFNRWTKASHTMKTKPKTSRNQRWSFSVNQLSRLLFVGLATLVLSHFLAGELASFLGSHFPTLSRYSLTSASLWLVFLVSALGIVASFTSLQKLYDQGGSELATFSLYLLITIIGMQLNLSALAETPWVFLIGGVWLVVHISVMMLVAKLFRLPLVLLAIGSQANVGGAASAPIVAAAFSKDYVPFAILMALLGYVVGTYAAYLTSIWMSVV